MFAVLEQFPFAAVTVYVVADVGNTITEEPVCPPGFQTYVVPPLAVNVVASPEQIVLLPETAIVGFGTGVTVMFETAEAVQPFAAVTVTVYADVIVGETEIIFVVCPLGFQRYVPPPDAVSVAFCPAQIELFVAETLAVGDGFTLTVILVSSEQVPFETFTV